jgi:hypothetical protein
MPSDKDEKERPAGGPTAERNRAMRRREAMLDAAGDDLVRELIAKALAGDEKALRLCIERLPRRGNRPLPFELPRVDSVEGARQAAAAIMAAMERKELSPREADEFLQVIELAARIIAATDRDAGRAAATHQSDLGGAGGRHGPSPESPDPEWGDWAAATGTTMH